MPLMNALGRLWLKTLMGSISNPVGGSALNRRTETDPSLTARGTAVVPLARRAQFWHLWHSFGAFYGLVVSLP